MKKEYLYCVISVLAMLCGIIFMICALILRSNPNCRRSALLLLSIVLIITGLVSLIINLKKYHTICDLTEHQVPVIAHWTFSANSSKIISDLIEELKNNSIATAILFLILSIIFWVVFAYSGGTSILYLGYIFIVFSICIFIIALRMITAYYEKLNMQDTEVIFGEDYFYFIDELYTFQRGYHCLQQVSVYEGGENALIFSYGLYDADEPAVYTVTIPIPSDKLHTAKYIRTYYNNLLTTLL